MADDTPPLSDDVLEAMYAMLRKTQYTGPYAIFVPGCYALVDADGGVTWWDYDDNPLTLDEARLRCPLGFFAEPPQ